MAMKPQVLTARVRHRRLGATANAFEYGVWYLAMPLSALAAVQGSWRFAIDRPAVSSLRSIDHGARDGSGLQQWIDALLDRAGMRALVEEVLLVTMPRVLGYGFNPASFWFCLDRDGDVRAVLCEVNNTFGETHSYLCVHQDRRPIRRGDRMRAEKVFHVSPFLERNGSYEFGFSLGEEELSVWITLFDEAGQRQLVTSLSGRLEPMTATSLRRAFWRHKLVPLKAILLIHWQALKLVARGLRYIPKPRQRATRFSASADLTRM